MILHLFRQVNTIQVKTLLQILYQALRAEEEWNVVDRGNIVNADDLIGRYMAKHRYLVFCSGFQGVAAQQSAGNLGSSYSELEDGASARGTRTISARRPRPRSA